MRPKHVQTWAHRTCEWKETDVREKWKTTTNCYDYSKCTSFCCDLILSWVRNQTFKHSPVYWSYALAYRNRKMKEKRCDDTMIHRPNKWTRQKETRFITHNGQINVYKKFAIFIRRLLVVRSWVRLFAIDVEFLARSFFLIFTISPLHYK